MELKDYLHVIRVRKWIVIIAVVVVTATAFGVSLVMPKVYEGEARVLITTQDAGSSLLGASLSDLTNAPDRGLQTQVQLVQARPILERVIRDLGLKTTPDKLQERVKVTGIGQTNLISITVQDATPQGAARTAQAIAETYVSWSQEFKRESIQNAADQVEARLTDAQQEILDLGGKLDGDDGAGELVAELKSSTNEQARVIERLISLRAKEETLTGADLASAKAQIRSAENDLALIKAGILDLGDRLAKSGRKDSDAETVARLQIATGLYTTLAEKYESLRIQEQLEVGSGKVVSPATMVQRPVSPKPLRNGVLGLALGVAFGLGMAFLAEKLDVTIKSTDQVEALYGAPVLGNVPLERFEKDEPRRLTIVEHPGSRAAEAYRSLRNGIDYVNFEHNIKTLLVTSAAPSEGKSTVSANLAAALAMAGSKVVLLNCDFRCPTTDEFFEVDNHIGLSDLLAGRVTLEAALQDSGDQNLVVLTPGKMPPNPSELLGSQKMSDLVWALKEAHDWVIVDSPPLLAVADAAAAARWTDGVLVVTRAGASTHPAAEHAHDLLQKVGARVIGVVVWGLDDELGGNGAYGSYYGGNYGSYHSGYDTYDHEGQPDSGAKSTLGARSARRQRRASG